MMVDPSYNFYEVVNAAESYFETHDKGKGSGYIGYLRWKHFNEPKYYPSGNRLSANEFIAIEAFEKFLPTYTYLSKTSFPNGWSDLGPYDADNITSHYSAGIGRVETFYVDPLDSNKIYLGSRSGGFWRTSDEGQNWLNTTDYLLASGVNTIAVSPSNIDSVLINVQNANNGITHGIYRSTNGGFDWAITDFNADNLGKGGLSGTYFRIYKIAYHPLDANTVFICTSSGIYKSDPSLTSWTVVSGGVITDIEFHPSNPDIIYCFNNNSKSRILRSINGGNNFNYSSTLSGNNATSYISVSPSNANLVYVASTDGIWKSTDQGINFTFISNPNESCRGFAVSDLDSNLMLYGYVDTEASKDEGKNFTQVTQWSAPKSNSYVHADIRTLECLNGRFYIGTDGYFCKSNDVGTTWTKLNNGTGIRENYRLGVCQGNAYRAMCGSQDNGTSIITENGWIEWNGGDGMEAIIHPLNDDWMIGSWQYGQRSVTKDGGQSRKGLGNPQYGSGFADWIAPMLMDPFEHMSIYHFGSNIYKSDSFGEDFIIYGLPNLGGVIGNAAIAQNNPDIMIVSRRNTIKISTDAGGSFTDITNTLTNQYVSSLNFDPNNDNTIIATYASYYNDNSKVFISYNQGQSWQNITYNLGNMPVHHAVIDKTDSSYIYLGTEIGVYYKSLSSTNWTLYSTNLPNVSVREIEIHKGSNRLKAVTWGRGLWEYETLGREDYPSILTTSITDPPTKSSPAEGVEQFVKSTISYKGTLANAFIRYSVDNISLDQTLSMSLLSDSTWISDNSLPLAEVNSNIYFKVYAVGENGDTSETFRFMYKVKEFEYCSAIGDFSTGADYIDYVELNDYKKSSEQEYYADFSSEVITLKKDSSYTLIIGLNFHWDPDTTAAWIDFNNNGVFDESEWIEMGPLDNLHLSSGEFTVPSDARIGDTLRMRVRNQYWDNSPNPCGTESGEVEDFSVVIVDASVGYQKHEIEEQFYIYPNPSEGIINVDLKQMIDALNVKVFSVSGQLHFEQDFARTKKISLNLDLPAGTYFLQINTAELTDIQKLILID